METLTIDEKKAYVKRIDDKAQQDNISNKHACRRLGLHEWKYYQYKNDVRRAEAKQPAASVEQDAAMNEVAITITLTKQAYEYLKTEAADFALEPATVGQLMLHHAIMKASRDKQEVTP